MSPDLAAMTGSVVLGRPDVQACLLLSADGLPIAAFPPEHERRAADAWLRLAELGEVRRGFVVVGDELWVFAEREGYTALAVAKASARPALVLDRLDRMLADAARAASSAPADERPSAPAPAPRHEQRPATPQSRPTPRLAPAESGAARGASEGSHDDDEEEDEDRPAEREHRPDDTPIAGVDNIALAREFAGLIPKEEAG